MSKILLLTISFCFCAALGFSQTEKAWSLHNGNSGKVVTEKAIARQSFPKEFKLFDLNLNSLKQKLFSVVDLTSN